MKMRHLILLFTLLIFNNVIGQKLMRFTYSEAAMGTEMKLIFYASDSIKAIEIAQASFKKVKDLNTVFSDYDVNSKLVQLCNTYETNKQIKISDELFDILYQAKKISKLSDGLFDVTIGPLTKMWRQAKKENKLPTEQQLSAAKKTVGYKNIYLNHKAKTVKFKKSGIQIDLGGIAKGYTADEVLKVLKSYNIKQSLIDFGGDITVGNPPPNKNGWNVEVSYINHLGTRISKIITISNMSIATSGDYYQKLTIDNKTYSHIIDPSTGLGITKSIQVTVIAPTGTLADSFASAFSIMTQIQIEKLLHKNKEILVFRTLTTKDSTVLWKSINFNNLQNDK